jgi:hypothetical protein
LHLCHLCPKCLINPHKPSSSHYKIAPDFHPKSDELNCIWQVFWLVSFVAPSRVSSGILQQNFDETYSSGDCPGFAPVFPFNSGFDVPKTNCDAKVINVKKLSPLILSAF